MKASPRFSEPSDAEIRHAAYHLWLQGGRAFGRELDHWMKAKDLLRQDVHGSTRQPKRRRVMVAVTKRASRPAKSSKLR